MKMKLKFLGFWQTKNSNKTEVSGFLAAPVFQIHVSYNPACNYTTILRRHTEKKQTLEEFPVACHFILNLNILLFFINLKKLACVDADIVSPYI
jgi:hypothetical protein